MRPLDDHLVGVGEPLAGGEDRAGVAHGHPVAEELADAGHRAGEVDRPEDQHPRRRGEGLDEHRQVVEAPLTVGADVQHRGGAVLEHAAGVVGHRLVEPGRAQRAGDPVGPDHHAGPERARPVDERGDGHRLARSRIASSTSPSSGKRRGVDRLDEDVDDAAAGQPDRERVVVADAVALQHRHPGGHDLLGQLVDRALDAAAADAADRLAVVGHRHRGAGLARRGLPRRDHRRQPERRVPPPEPLQLVDHVTHDVHLSHERPAPRPAPRAPQACDLRRSRQRGAAPPPSPR